MTNRNKRPETTATAQPVADPIQISMPNWSQTAAPDHKSQTRNQMWLPTAQHVEHWPLDRLVPYLRNPRTHSDAQVAKIAASIAEFGFINPILVDTNAGIIAGH